MIKRLDVPGGAERIVAELVRGEQCQDVLVFDGGRSFFALGKKRELRAKNLFQTAWRLWTLKRKYKIFHLHLFPSIYFSLLFGKKTIVHEHNTHNARRQIPALRPLERLVYRRARSVIAISEGARTALENWVGPGLNIKVLPNFVAPLAKTSGTCIPARRDEEVLVVMIASFTEQKRQELLIRSLKHLPDYFRLVFAGTGPKLEGCKALTEDLALSNRVEFLGAISNVAELYLQADLCVLVSHWEGFGLVVLEAAQFGVPTVVSNVEGLRDTCPDSRLLFSGDNPAYLSTKIRDGVKFGRSIKNRQTLHKLAKKHGIAGYRKQLDALYED